MGVYCISKKPYCINIDKYKKPYLVIRCLIQNMEPPLQCGTQLVSLTIKIFQYSTNDLQQTGAIISDMEIQSP